MFQRRWRILLGVVGIWTGASPAFADLPACGVDCITRSRVVLCNDSASVVAPTTISCTPTTCQNEVVCATFSNIPAAAYPIRLTGAWLVMGPQSFSNAFTFEVYQDDGNPAPGPRIAPTAPNGFALAGMPMAFTRIPGPPPPGPGDIDLPASYTITAGDFRICLRKQLPDIPDVCHDVDGFSGSNPMLSGSPAGSCLGPSWQESADLGLSGDFLFRAEIEPADLTPFGGLAVCESPDAGVPDTGVDAGTVADSGMDEDAMAADAAAPPPDSGTKDSGAADTGDPSSVMDAGGMDAGETGPPRVDSIIPEQASNQTETSVTILGGGFREGAIVRLDDVEIEVTQLAGDTTLLANVPANLSAGVYDVLVFNPDGQAGVLAEAFTVTAPGSGPIDPSAGQVSDGCGCTATKRPSFSFGWGIVLWGGWWCRRRGKRSV